MQFVYSLKKNQVFLFQKIHQMMAHDPQQLQQLSDWLRDALAPLGLAVNAKKTKYMVVAEPGCREAAVATAFA